MKVGTRTCLDWNTCAPLAWLLEQVEQAERGLLIDGVVHLALGMQPSHALLAVAGDQRALDSTGGMPLRTRGQALLPAGFLIPYFMAASFRMTTSHCAAPTANRQVRNPYLAMLHHSSRHKGQGRGADHTLSKHEHQEPATASRNMR